MTLELTEQQWRMVEEQAGRPVAIVDPGGHCSHMLIAREQFEKVRPLLDDSWQAPASSQISLDIPPGIRRSQATYWQDLPELLKQRKLRGQWVCYYGEERIGIARKKAELVQQCLQRGLQRREFYVGFIEERPTPPWEPTDLEESLFEATEHHPATPPAAS